MVVVEAFLIALALCVDSLVVSTTSSFRSKMVFRRGLLMAVVFAFFQGLFPLLGALLGAAFKDVVAAVDHWIAFTLLAFIGGKMILDSFKADEEPHLNPSNLKTQLALSVATSIDALAVGITYACTGYQTWRSISLPLAVIGLISFLMSILGFCLGARFGESVNKKMRPELLGGIILIGIGVKILIEHLSA